MLPENLCIPFNASTLLPESKTNHSVNKMASKSLSNDVHQINTYTLKVTNHVA